MTKMNLITRHILCQAAPSRFAMQYRDRMDVPLADGKPPQKTYDKLVNCDLNPETINRIMGNDSWTQLTCNACRKDVESVISIDVTGGEYATYICEDCVKKMAALF